ncbi:MAG: SDR family NAD(P)-dependent oxidoreductase, partial [Myxococcota bacterium]
LAPVAVEEVVVWAYSGGAVRCFATATDPVDLDDGLIRGDIFIVEDTESGFKPIGFFGGLLLKRTSREALLPRTSILKDVLATSWTEVKLPAERHRSPNSCFCIVGHGDGFADDVVQRLRLSTGCDVRQAAVDDLGSLTSITDIVYIADVDGPLSDAPLRASRRLRRWMRHILQTEGAPAKLWLVARLGLASDDSPARVRVESIVDGALWGLMSVCKMEHPELTYRCVDLGTSDDHEAGVDRLLNVLLSSIDYTQVAFHRERWFRPRLSTPTLKTEDDGERSFWLGYAQPGSIDALRRFPLAKSALEEDQVRIRVRANGLNFRDVLSVLGKYPGDPGPLGCECVGEVVEVYTGARNALGQLVEVGARVMAYAQGTLASHAVVDAAMTITLPAALSDEAAATLPGVFLTAFYSCVHLGKLAQGQRVLVHSASGGVGLACLQWARAIGAEVYATAGTSRKRGLVESYGATLVMDSRSLEFEQQIRHHTGGAGVDLVVNSLTGPAIQAGLNSLSPGGRFIELGKNDIWTEDRVRSYRSDIEYRTIDLPEVARRQPEILMEGLKLLSSHLSDRTIRPLPRQIFSIEEAGAAFRRMANAQHLGKIVISHRSRQPRLSASADYLLTGGLGGIGLELASWLIERGAKRLTLLGRRAPSAGAASRIEDFRAQGVHVSVERVDVSDKDELSSVISRMQAPLKGVFHLAGVLADGSILHQSDAEFAAPFPPKIAGLVYLDELTRDVDLDYFVVFSAGAAIVGTPGQA